MIALIPDENLVAMEYPADEKALSRASSATYVRIDA